jgi:16S rRNA (cytidine1402-2'-O)-methyltransferase
MTGTLYLVATPIGNLGDITIRALETLKSVDLIACEDTRQTGKLLHHFGISAKLLSYHEHNEHERAEELKNLLLAGKNVAVATDAGTPGIADPAFRVVQAAIEAEINIVPIPGAIAFANAAIVSGLPTDALFFGNFLPARKNERRRRLQETATIPATLVFYESPHRLKAALADCLEILGNRQAAVVRELTKLHEEAIRGNLKDLISKYAETEPRGEIVLVIERASIQNSPSKVSSQKTIAERVGELESEGLNQRAALKQAAREFDVSRSEAYRRLVEEKNSEN